MNLETLAFVSLVLAAVPCGLFLSNLFGLSAARGAENHKIRRRQRVDSGAQRGTKHPRHHRSRRSRIAELNLKSSCWTTTRPMQRPKLSAGFAASDARVRLEAAPPLPAGWCGKQHACHVLAQLAKNPLLVFMDADVRLAPDALARMAGFMEENPVALASGVPRQETGTFSERLLIPLIHFILLGFLPMRADAADEVARVFRRLRPVVHRAARSLSNTAAATRRFVIRCTTASSCRAFFAVPVFARTCLTQPTWQPAACITRIPKRGAALAKTPRKVSPRRGRFCR